MVMSGARLWAKTFPHSNYLYRTPDIAAVDPILTCLVFLLFFNFSYYVSTQPDL